MRAMAQASWRQGEAMSLVELPVPAVRGDQVRVAVAAIGVNPVDWKLRSLGPLRLAARLTSPPPPVVVGVDFAGTVDAVGPRVRGCAVGDAVVGGTVFARRQRGSYADTVVVREDQLVRLPPGFDLQVAAALPVAGATAWLSVVEVGRVRPDDRVLVIGASGGVGHLAVQIAKARGARVVGVCSTPSIERVRGYGADVVIDYRAGDPLAAAAAHGPYRAVIDCVGGYAASRCRALLDAGGRHVVVSGDTVGALVSALARPFTSKVILGRPTPARLQPVVDLVAAGTVRVEIAQRLPLTEAERAHELGRSGAAGGKIVLVP